MKRSRSGSYETISTVSETCRAFVPHPLPPKPPITWEGDLQDRLTDAVAALGRLDGIASMLPDTDVFLYSYVRKEAVLSSQIEGTQSSLSDLLLFENQEVPGVPLDDVQEVSNYVAAMNHGMKRLKEGFPISLRLLRELHGVLLSKGRGSNKQPGEFRTSQNWIGGTRPGNAAFVPPPPARMIECLDALEKFLHDQPARTPSLLKAALAHAQFETIHPFLDGNGRVGRLLVTLLLCSEKVLSQPLLYLSLFFRQHRSRYYALLQKIRDEGDWEAWLAFFFEGVAVTGGQAVATAHRLQVLFREDRDRIKSLKRATGSALELHRFLQTRPMSTVPQAHKALGISIPTLHAAARNLIRLGILQEVPHKSKAFVFAYKRCLEALSRDEASTVHAS